MPVPYPENGQQRQDEPIPIEEKVVKKDIYEKKKAQIVIRFSPLETIHDPQPPYLNGTFMKLS